MATLRKTKKRAFCGVCGGIAKWIDPDINPLGIRLMWVFLTIFHPWTMIISYFFLAGILKTELALFPEEPKPEMK